MELWWKSACSGQSPTRRMCADGIGCALADFEKTLRPAGSWSNRQAHAIGVGGDAKAQLREADLDAKPTKPRQFKTSISQEFNRHAEPVKASGLAAQ